MDFHDACIDAARAFADGRRSRRAAFEWLRDDWPALFGALNDLHRAVLPTEDLESPHDQ